LNLYSESAERTERLRGFQQSTDQWKKDDKYFAEPLTGSSSNVREAVHEDAGAI
jgi:hypothetical protein